MLAAAIVAVAQTAAATNDAIALATADTAPLVMNDGVPLAGFEKFLLTDFVAAGAVCLDGSPGGGYIRKGDPKKWIIFHQGGGWCGSDANCAQRANCSHNTPGCIMGGTCCALGSSTVWGPTYTDAYEASQIFADPAFQDYTAVYAMYCDGGSWTGNADSPVVVNGKKVWYRGRRLLDALLDYMLDQGLKTANELMFGGCSAGGLTCYLHADYVASRMPKGVQTRAICDAMFSANVPHYDGAVGFPANMQWGYTAWNSSGSANSACAASFPPAERWKCFFGQEVAKHVKTPLFVLNSKYDSWQGPAIIGCGTVLKSCPPAAVKYWVEYGANMTAAAHALPSQHGVFIANCRAHCQTGTAAAWNGTTVDGTAMGDAFKSWYFQKEDSASYATQTKRWIEECPGNDGSCGADKCG